MVFSTQFDARDHFNPRSPRGERLRTLVTVLSNYTFQSTLSEGRATRGPKPDLQSLTISIHALRGESDSNSGDRIKQLYISIHALRGESDYNDSPPMPLDSHFNPRSPRGERPLNNSVNINGFLISIHALRGESDKNVRTAL